MLGGPDQCAGVFIFQNRYSAVTGGFESGLDIHREVFRLTAYDKDETEPGFAFHQTAEVGEERSARGRGRQFSLYVGVQDIEFIEQQNGPQFIAQLLIESRKKLLSKELPVVVELVQ